MAKEQGVPVTAEVTPHHLMLTDERVLGPAGSGSIARYDTHAKMRPPLRTELDRRALVDGLREGLIDIVATDHAPHASEDKECEFAAAANGVVGLETAFGVLMRLVHDGRLDLAALIRRLTVEPARILTRGEGLVASSIPKALGTLQVGAPADVVLLDPGMAWTVDPGDFASKGRNTPFAGWDLRGRVIATVVSGNLVHNVKAASLQT
jgi:dihydroorotase